MRYRLTLSVIFILVLVNYLFLQIMYRMNHKIINGRSLNGLHYSHYSNIFSTIHNSRGFHSNIKYKHPKCIIKSNYWIKSLFLKDYVKIFVLLQHIFFFLIVLTWSFKCIVTQHNITKLFTGYFKHLET